MKRVGSASRLLVATIVLGALVVAGGLPATASGRSAPPRKQPKSAWSLAPYDAPNAPSRRFFFLYSLHAGESIEDHIQLTNFTSHPITFDLYPSDATNAVNGGAFTLQPPKSKQHAVGTWIRFGFPSITVPAGRVLVIGFVLGVPSGVSPGDYAGGIVALDTSTTSSPTGPVGLRVRQAIGLALYVRVSGPIVPGLAISDLKVITAPRGSFAWLTGEQQATIEFRLDNVGNSRINATARVRVTGTFGGSVGKFAPVTIDNLLPGSSVHLAVPWPDVPELGAYHVDVTAASASGVGTAGATVDAAAAALDLDLPWVLLLLVILLLLGLVGLALWRHRRKRKVRQGAAPSSRRARKATA